MYWYKNSLILFTIFSFFALIIISGCKAPDVKESKGQYKYFDLKGFMRKDSASVSASNPTVVKTVNHNGEAETRILKISNWSNELGLFTASDINKPSWRDGYSVFKKGDSVLYQANTPDLKTQKLIVYRQNGKVVSLHIFNRTKNILYETSEELEYTPGVLYSINKKQHVILLGSNRYIVKGKFVK